MFCCWVFFVLFFLEVLYFLFKIVIIDTIADAPISPSFAQYPPHLPGPPQLESVPMGYALMFFSNLFTSLLEDILLLIREREGGREKLQMVASHMSI